MASEFTFFFDIICLDIDKFGIGEEKKDYKPLHSWLLKPLQIEQNIFRTFFS